MRAPPPAPLFACRDLTLRPASHPAPPHQCTHGAHCDASAAQAGTRCRRERDRRARTFSRSILSVKTTSRAARKMLKSSSRWSRSVSVRERPNLSGLAAACAARACSIAAAIAGSLSGLSPPPPPPAPAGHGDRHGTPSDFAPTKLSQGSVRWGGTAAQGGRRPAPAEPGCGAGAHG
jgi:hypothetical protein